jgi:excisionase family DNA binding protein
MREPGRLLRRHTAAEAERIQTPELAQMMGVSVRLVQLMAAAGDIPSAAQFGSRWTFDRLAVRRWIKQREAARCRKISISGAVSGGVASRPPEPNIDEAYARAIGLKPSAGSKRGGKN